MENPYIILLFVAAALAVLNLIVGVGNDAVNFLNSAVGAKALSLRSILAIAGLGIAVGVLFSPGLIEVSRSGIFDPGRFSFHEVSLLFTAVMLSNILLLNFFNSIGIPVSTTVTVLCGLLGAAVAIGLLQLWDAAENAGRILEYINTDRAVELLVGIVLSVLLAFCIGGFVQFLARLAFTFRYQKNIDAFGALFAGFAITCLLGFIVLKGFANVSYLQDTLAARVQQHLWWYFLVGLIGWSFLAHIAIRYFDLPVLKYIIGLGLFALALSFAANDLMNFVGVPFLLYESYGLWEGSGVAATHFTMGGLVGVPLRIPLGGLLLSGLVMVGALWFSKRALLVTQTEIDLAGQQLAYERFKPHYFSRLLVRGVFRLGILFRVLTSDKVNRFINRRFEPLEADEQAINRPAFDLVRASVNLIVATGLISVATAMQLPLSTTFVTFMVAMGTALADRAWNHENAAYRVAGVLNIVGSWFLVALFAFVLAFVLAGVLYFGKLPALLPLLALLAYVLIRSFLSHRRRIQKERTQLKLADIEVIHEITMQHAEAITAALMQVNERYGQTVHNLALQDFKKLKRSDKELKTLAESVGNLRDRIILRIRTKEFPSDTASSYYLLTVGNLEDMVAALQDIVQVSREYVDNHHKNLTFNQVKGLKFIDNHNKELFAKLAEAFSHSRPGAFEELARDTEDLREEIARMIDNHIRRIAHQQADAANIKLYITLLKKSKELTTALHETLERFANFYKDTTPKDIIR